MISYDTYDKMERRLAEINGEKVERLSKLYHITKDPKYLWILQKDYGLDTDFIQGFDSGEGPRGGLEDN